MVETWEYKVECLGVAVSQLQPRLDTLGAEGWELATSMALVLQTGSHLLGQAKNEPALLCVFKRRKGGSNGDSGQGP